MNFDSAFYLFCFLPVIMLLFAVVRGTKGRNVLLLVCGLVFYSFGSLNGLVLLLASALINYIFGLGLMSGRGRKPLIILGVVLNLAFLGAYKYLDFLLAGIAGIFGSAWKSAGLIAPVGISFFTFRSISYLIDLYRDEKTGTKNFPRLLLYISFFPQLMAGPISRFSEFAPQLDRRLRGSENTAEGIRRLIIGLGKKLIIAAAMGDIADAVFAFGNVDFRLAWLGAIAYTLQIYFDFAGYSDMAIGMGRALGFVTAENFDYPYIAASVTEFWRRWHISLSSWFRDYLYIPLGGNRKGKVRAAVNKFIVFTLCGLWHGANWTFIIWGAWHGLFSALESLKVINTKRIPKVVGHVYTLLVVCLGFVMFRAASVGEGFTILGSMFAGFDFTPAGTVLVHRLLDGEGIFMLILACICSLPIGRKLWLRLGNKGGVQWVSFALSLVLFVLCLFRLAAGGFSPFIYFQF